MSVAPNLLRHLGGVPVASAANFAAWWGRKMWFVDYDSGTTGAYGNDMLSPQKNLKTILDHTDFGAGDGVFIKPRTPDVSGGDPAAITPASAVNWTIANADHSVSLIGTGLGGYITRLQGHGSVTAYPTLQINAPFVCLENLGLRRGASTSGIVKIYSAASAYNFGCVLKNCHIRLADAAGGVIIESAWYTKLLDCTFSSCRIGVYIGASISVPAEIVIAGGEFIGLTSEIDGNIFSSGAVTRISVHDMIMNHAVPAFSGGSIARYIKFSATSTGLVANISTGAVDPTVADNMTLNGVLYSNIWGDGVGPFVDA